MTGGYYCVNRRWYHYFEWMYHCNLDTDILYMVVGDVPITICDMYSKDKQFLSEINPREYKNEGIIRRLFRKMEGMKQQSCYNFYQLSYLRS